MAYVISTYRPGYLPENEPHTTESIDNAIRILISEISATIDIIEDDGEFLDADTALHVASVDTKARAALTVNGAYYYDVAGYRHAVETY
jgi:hypothetical protein